MRVFRRSRLVHFAHFTHFARSPLSSTARSDSRATIPPCAFALRCVAACAALAVAAAMSSPVYAKPAKHKVPKVPAAAPSHAPLPAPLARLLTASKVPAGHVSVLVAKVDNPLQTRGRLAAPLISMNEKVPRNPASTMKLVTTIAALDTLGPDYRWRTQAFTDGQFDGRTLNGNLYFKGTGDPKLVPEEMEKFVAELHNAGVANINGDIVLDRSAYSSDIGAVDAIDGGDDRPYNVAPDALLYSFKAMSFNFSAGPNGAVNVNVLPPLANLQVANEIAYTDTGNCGDWLTRLHPTINPSPDGGYVARFAGTYPAACDEKDWSVAAPDRDRFFLGGFRALWQASGGQFNGNVRSGVVPPGAKLLVTHRGQTLAEVVHDMNKFSNNVMARQLFLTLGLPADGRTPASVTRSREALSRWLDKNDLSMPGLVVENGSGLSRRERISAAELSGLLQHAINSPTAQVLVESMPTVGVDGTMRNRLTNSPVAGNAHIKTGTLDDVRAVAGYVGTRSGNIYVVVSLVNDAKANNARAFNDALISWVYENAP
ncbi:D-alanyl-D-alanine carboxypeptidase DacC [Pandoraea pneumonica]|uniref:D-alanyl-D-alanine carboxypeptidase DacC n=2 Tax=Pandoraea pneumonica TaxID=2508299 RepID=A0A5E4YFP2_9BURK|nr:D-alanyl-D-alanine carboxypeptidase/D-alanyl-D-alanine-endopeptidase [Pandoraea pneumonica]VVE47272.1 D-alanyl-D-alanine carboxypeptidase DacC [Pandoraea pneumonica]